MNWRELFWLPFCSLMVLTVAVIGLPSVAQAKEYIDVTISIFDMNLPEDEQTQRQQGIYPQVRAAEAKYMPALLRATLLESDRWGAIRIMPESDAAAELMIAGSIIHSDGLSLELAIVVQDSSGREWLNTRYSAQQAIGVSLLEEALNIDPFQSLYNQILNDLVEHLELLSVDDVLHIKTLAELRYASTLAPDAFANYLLVSEEGLYDYVRLPASNDPFLQRVQEIRQHEYIFTDVVDNQYQDFLTKIKPSYDLWREYKKDLAQNSTDFAQRQSIDSQFSRGSYLSLKDSYNNYRWQRMQGQFLDQLSIGFSNEVKVTELNLEDSMYRLNGTLAEQYKQWREILSGLYQLQVDDEQ